VVTRDYRILVEGALRPPVIGPWFPGPSWWHEFFRNFEFPGAPPAAKADVRGSWISGHKAVVFVAVDSRGPVVRGVPFDRVRTRLYIKPGTDDGLYFRGDSGPKSISGSFLRRFDIGSGAWQSVDFDVASTFDLPPIARIMGSKEGSFLDAFGFERPPTVRVTGHVDGPGSEQGAHETLHIKAATDGAFRFHDFPFTRVAFVSDVQDDDIRVSPIEAGFAGGTVAGWGRLRGRGAAQRVEFKGSLKGASLGQAIGLVEGFTAMRAHVPPPPLTKFVKEKSSVRLDVEAAGEGPGDDFLGYHGGGKASLEGAELGELRMLGLFSDLLPFGSLRFTSARADFKIDGRHLDFSDVSVTGANSAIRADGSYELDTHALDFKARFFPFQKSKTLPQVLIGSVLAPLSEFLEVRLGGSVENPSWAFERGPTNFIRSLATPEPSGQPVSPVPPTPAIPGAQGTREK
jgi:hypothetical protein